MQMDKLAFATVLALGLFVTPEALASHRRADSVVSRSDLDPYRARIVAAAYEHLERNRAPRRRDCSGLIHSVLADAGAMERGGTPAIFARASAEGRLKQGAPLPGDLVFFDRTFDRDRDGRVDDPLTHVAIVVDVRADGTVDMVHLASSGTSLLRMNLRRPHKHKKRGAVVNDFLSAPGYGRPRLTGELFRAFASPPRPRIAEPWLADAPPLPHGGHDGHKGPRAPSYDGPAHGRVHRHEHEHAKHKRKNKHKHKHEEGRACDCHDNDGGRGDHDRDHHDRDGHDHDDHDRDARDGRYRL